MKVHYAVIMMALIIGQLAYADTIKVSNEAKKDVWVAIYYMDSSRSTRAGLPQKVAKGKTINVSRPDAKSGSDRQLAISYDDKKLDSKFTNENFNKIPQVNVGNTRGDKFYIAVNEGKLDGFNEASWTISQKAGQAGQAVIEVTQIAGQKIDETAQQIIDSFLLKNFRKGDFPRKNETAVVRTGVDISQNEVAFRSKRLPIIRKAIADLMQDPVKAKVVSQPTIKVPTIGLCISGGGYRAMLAGNAYIAAADKMGLLNSSMYIATLSGSTWGLTSWLTSNKTPGQWLEVLKKVTQKKFSDVNINVLNQMLTKLAYGEEISYVDFWGGHIGDKVLGSLSSNTEKYTLSALQPRVDSGLVPMPICTAIAEKTGVRLMDYKWFEFTPYEIGSVYIKAWIPTWSLGRKFDKGRSINAVPEQTLSYFMGVFGAAFSIGFVDILDPLAGIAGKMDPMFKDVAKIVVTSIKKELKQSAPVAGRIIPGSTVPNFAYNLSVAPSHVQSQRVIEFIDAGFSGSGNPLPPLLRAERALDIIVVFDINETAQGAPNLRAAVQYAKDNNLKFPKVDFDKADKQSVAVFGDPEDLSTPVVIFLPRIQNKKLNAPYNFDMEAAVTGKNGWAGTIPSFTYSEKNADLLSGWAYNNLLSHEQVIKDVIAKRLKALNPGKF